MSLTRFSVDHPVAVVALTVVVIVRSFAAHSQFDSNWYERRALPWALGHPITVIVTCCALLFAAFALVVLRVVGGEVLPRSQRGSMTAAVSDPVGTPVRTTEAGVKRRDMRTSVGAPGSKVALEGVRSTLLPPGRLPPIEGSAQNACRSLFRAVRY